MLLTSWISNPSSQGYCTLEKEIECIFHVHELEERLYCFQRHVSQESSCRWESGERFHNISSDEFDLS